jgi:hypothetical protein
MRDQASSTAPAPDTGQDHGPGKAGPSGLAGLGHCLLGLGAFLLGCELLLRLLPVSSATQVDHYLDPLILSYPPHFEWTSSTGWDLRNPQRNHTNNVGFTGRRDMTRHPRAVALIGDSYVESAMLRLADRPAEQLEQALNDAPVFALGMPGSALLDYAERMRWAQAQYGLRRFVLLLERGDLRQSLCGSGNVHGPCLDPRTFAPRTEAKPPAGPLKRVLRHSALARYLTGQLKLDAARLWKQALLQSRAPVESEQEAKQAPPPVAKPAATEPSAASRAVTAAFLQRIAGLTLDDLVIVIDTQRERIYNGQTGQDADLLGFADALRAAGARVVMAEPILAEHFRQHGLRFEVGPYDGHLNPLGVKLLMGAAARALGTAAPRP